MALADELKKRNYNICFIVRPDEFSTLSDYLKFDYRLMDYLKKPRDFNKGYEHWLGVSQCSDAEEAFLLSGQETSATWIVDHYGISDEWEEYISSKGNIVIAIDDLARTHFVDFIIDYNLTAELEDYKESNRKKSSTTYLLGPNYSILRDQITKSEHYRFEPGKDSYLLSLGGVSPELFNKFINPLRRFNFHRLEVLNPPADFAPEANEFIIRNSKEIVTLYQKQNIVFGACGVANLERMFLGVPTISVVVSDNQKRLGEKIEKLGLQHHLGDLNFLSENDIFNKLRAYLQNLTVEDFIKKSEKCTKLIPQNGIKRIIDELEHVIE